MSTHAPLRKPKSPALQARRLRDGSVVSEASAIETVSLETRCPAKWAFVDLETGDIWLHDKERGFVRAPRERAELVRQVAATAAVP